jgi:hypothetical protein
MAVQWITNPAKYGTREGVNKGVIFFSDGE